MLGTYQKTPTDPGDHIVRYRSPEGDELKLHMEMAIGGLAIATEMMALAVKKFDEIHTPFAVLCEREIYEGGTWPAGTDYPLKRS